MQPDEETADSKAENVVAYWAANNIQKAHEHFLKTGAKENEKPYNAAGEIWVATVKDPWGNTIGLIFSVWQKTLCRVVFSPHRVLKLLVLRQVKKNIRAH